MLHNGYQEVRAVQIKTCSCPGRPEDKPVALSSAILTYCCPQCAGGVASVSDYLHGIMQRVDRLRVDLYEAPGDVAPPGKAVITSCSTCGGRGCKDCGGSSRVLWRACPKCGDIGFDYLNGRDEADGMVCRNGCGFRWAADDPVGWRNECRLAFRQPEKCRRQSRRTQFSTLGGTTIECSISTKETRLACGRHCRFGSAGDVAGRDGRNWLHSQLLP